ncbi:MAG: DUF3800 domain-containing protein [Sarcina sp.]
MEEYHFYYDESEHSRKINLNTVSAQNYYDNFIVSIVGWKAKSEKLVLEEYEKFEEKYSDRKSKGELKSQTLKQKQFEHGFASVNKNNNCFIADFFSVFNNDIEVYLAVISKTEFIISQLFDGYKNSFLCDMDAMKYSIVKAILMYQPKEIIEGMFENTGELIEKLKKFFKDKIYRNRVNVALKAKENKAFEDILSILYDIQEINSIEWDYNIAFLGFKEYLIERGIDKFILIIDEEGEDSNTLNAAKKTGFSHVREVDSKDSVGVRISDMLAGILSKLLKALHNSLKYNSSEKQPQKKILGKEWFLLSQEQLDLYKKLYIIICNLNRSLHKTFSGKYSDDLMVLTALLHYMNQFSSPAEIKNQNIDMQGEYFNTYVCDYLEEYYNQMRNKLPIDLIQLDEKKYFLNQRGAKVFFDMQYQPLLKLRNGYCKCNILSVGFSKEGIPLATITESNGNCCYRLPEKLTEWTIAMVEIANKGTNLFPAEVIFTEEKGRFYADIL